MSEKTEQTTTVHHAEQFMLELFKPGSPVQSQYSGCIGSTEHYQKKKGKLVKDDKGQPIVSSVTVKPLPRVSKENPDLKGILGQGGQALMLFAANLDREFTQAAAAKFAADVASGLYAVASVTRSRTGREKFVLKPTVGSAVNMSEEQFKSMAEQRGYTLVPKAPEEKPEPTEQQQQAADDKAQKQEAKRQAEAAIRAKQAKAEVKK